MLLDHLERGNSALQPLLLSLAADLLLQSPIAHSCFADWLSDLSGRTGAQLLLALWREAEGEWGVCTDGVLTCTKRPLAGIGKRALWIPKSEVRFAMSTALSYPAFVLYPGTLHR